jgi:hypothetical protein
MINQICTTKKNSKELQPIKTIKTNRKNKQDIWGKERKINK